MRKHWKALIAAGIVATIALTATTAVLAEPRTGFGRRGMAQTNEGTLADKVGALFGSKMGGMRVENAPAIRNGRRGGMASEAVAEALGLTLEELRAELEAGKTLAEIAEEQGVDLQDLRDAAQAEREQAMRDAITQAVDDGAITQAEADWRIEGMDNGYGPGGIAGPKGMPRGGRGGSSETLAEMLGMTTEELATQFWGGRTLADLAEAAGVELADIREAVQAEQQAAMIEAIEQAVEDGTLDEAEAEWRIEGIENGYGRGPAGAAPMTAPMAGPGGHGRFGGQR